MIVNVLEQSVFYTGSSKTDFNFLSRFPEHYIGFRLKARLFALTGREATAAMDQVLFIEEVDIGFDTTLLLRSRLKKWKESLISYLSGLAKCISSTEYIQLFEKLYKKISFPTSIIRIYET